MKWLLLLIPIVIIILLLSYVKLNIIYVFYNGKSKLKVSTSYFFGLIKPEVIPEGDNKNNKNNQRSTEKNRKDANKTFSLQKLSNYKEIFYYIVDKSIIEKLDWKTKVGYEDPFILSMLYGTIWWIKGIINSFILSRVGTEKINLEVIPYYNVNLFNTRFNCIIKIRMVYIINVWIRLLKIYKGGEKNA
jgi:hypothetical protein